MENTKEIREIIDLNSIWKTHIDDGCEGTKQGWQSRLYDDSNWREVLVPCTFEDCLPELIGFKGTCWFRKKIEGFLKIEEFQI